MRPAAAILAASFASFASAALPAGAADGDAARGRAVYARCAACHAPAHDRTGPRHCGLVGRRAAGVPGFAYSDAMKGSGLVWDERTLERFIAAPLAVVPGTSMGYDGVKDPAERADLVAFLATLRTGSPECAR